jgi:hypothetical protein
VLVFLVSLAASTWRFPISSDGSAMLATARGLVERGSLAIDPAFARDDRYAPSARVGTDGRAYAKYGVGLPLVEAAPLAISQALAAATNLSRSRVTAAVLSLLNPALHALTALVVMRLVMTVGVRRRAAVGAGLAFAWATPATVYAATDGTESLQILLVAVVALGVTRLAQPADGGGQGPAVTWRPAWTGAALAYGILTKPLLAILAPALVVGVIASTRDRHRCAAPRVDNAAPCGHEPALREALAALIPVVAAVAVTAALNVVRFGEVAASGYNSPVLTSPAVVGLHGLLVGPNKGLPFYAPVVLLAPFGVREAWRRVPGLAAFAVAAAVPWTILNALFYEWGGGWAWGPRYLMPILPVAIVLAALAAEGGRARRAAWLSLAAVGLVVNALGTVISHDAFRRTTMNVWVGAEAGFVRAGAADGSGRLVEVPVPPEDVLPAFSPVAGHAWLARVALQGCDCLEGGDTCACRSGVPFEKAPAFLNPPWKDRYPDARPLPPYGVSIIEPALVRSGYEAFSRPARIR